MKVKDAVLVVHKVLEEEAAKEREFGADDKPEAS